MRILRKLMPMALALGLTGLITVPAQALSWGNTPVAYRQAGNHWSPMWGLPDTDRYVVNPVWLAPGEQFVPDCWFDFKDAYHYKNYSTPRWFRGWSKNHGWGYIHASFVYYQEKKPVGRC